MNINSAYRVTAESVRGRAASARHSVRRRLQTGMAAAAAVPRLLTHLLFAVLLAASVPLQARHRYAGDDWADDGDRSAVGRLSLVDVFERVQAADDEAIVTSCKNDKTVPVCDHIYTCYRQNPPYARKRIQNGVAPYTRQFVPFVVLYDTYNNDYYCGGVMISEFHFLTSAQCKPHNLSDLSIFQTQWSDERRPTIGPLDDDGGWCQASKYDYTRYGITTVIKHDWAIGKLLYPLRPYDDAEYACIAYKAKFMHKKHADVLAGWPEQYDARIRCYAMGHGWYAPGDSAPEGAKRAIKAIEVRPVPCGIRYIGFDTATGLCFESVQFADSGVCDRDIGGPVMCKMPHQLVTGDPRWWLVGIVSSFISGSCSGPFFATHVPSVVDDMMADCL